MIARLLPLRDRFDAVLLDLDGTLLDDTSRLTPRARRAVRTLVDAGFEVMLCTGRSVAGTTPIHDELGLDTAMVTYNGAWIGHPRGEAWRFAVIPDEVVPVLETVEQRSLFAFRHNGERKYSVPSGHAHYERVADWYTHVVRVHDVSDLPRTRLMRMSCYYDCPETLGAAWAAVEVETRDHVQQQTWPLGIFPEFADTGLVLCEMQAQGRGKAEVFAYLERERGIPPDRVIAVGDQQNDLPMLEAAGLPVAVGNASPDVLARAALVIGRNTQDGVAAWVEAGMPLGRAPGTAATS